MLIFNNDISDDHGGDLESIVLQGVDLSTSKPNNIVKLNTDVVLFITRIRTEKHIIIFHGNIFKDVTNVFKYPCKSTQIGIMKLG